MIRFQDVIGKQSISIQEGKNFGKVIDMFVDIKYLNVEGFVISDKDDRFLPFKEIKNIGEAVIFSSGEVLIPLSEKEGIDLRKGSSINGLRIITETGKENGTIASFYFKIDNGLISHFEIVKNIFKENLVMSRDAIVRIGEDAVIIFEEAAEIMNEMKKSNNIKINIKKAGKTVAIFTKSIFNKNIVENLKDKSKKILEKTKNGTAKIKDAVDKTIKKLKTKNNQKQ